MRSLLARIFLSFWLIIGITIGIAAVGGFWLAERLRDDIERFELSDVMPEASGALQRDGRAGLEDWLRALPGNGAHTVLVLDEQGHDILGRRVPWHVRRIIERHRYHSRRRAELRDDPPNLRRARPLSQLVGPDGSAYTFAVVGDPRPPLLRMRVPPGTSLFLLALFVSAAVSYLLARAIARPLTQLRDATVALADGRLDTRVADSVGGRRDEFGMLAREFDSMADKLQKSVAQQTELSRNISHELRSPLARMRVALELARRDAGGSAELDRIELETERLDMLIGQILSFSRLDAESPAAERVFSLSGLIAEVVDDVNYESAAKSPGVSVAAEVEAHPQLSGYPDALTSAIENILRNAVRHSPSGKRVVIRLRQPSAEEAIIEVLDEGPGVADDDLPNLFDAFCRTPDSADEGGYRGTGLGLAIAERAIRLNGGRVTAENRHSGGLRVAITLPLARDSGV